MTNSSMQFKEIADPTETFQQNADEWKRHIELEAYVNRELRLNTLLPCRYWGCFVQDEMVASCRACVRTAIVNGITGKEACIGNVYTARKARGNGYASHLLSAVTETLTKECILVTLWSDVGDFYSKFGYKMIADTKKLTIEVCSQEWPSQVQPVGQDQLSGIVSRHQGVLERKLGPDQVAIKPETYIYNYWIQESLANSEILGQVLPDIWGATVNESWCLWCYDLGRSKSLILLAMDGPQADLLVAAAHHTASSLGLAHIETYLESLITSDPAALGGKVEPRRLSLPAYISKYQWVYPGRYAWF